jgi:hypothetical protein
MRTRLFLALALPVILALACSLSRSPGPNTGAIPTEVATTEAVSTPTPTPPPDPVPVSINDGLASLNSYQMTMSLKSVGPDPAQSSATGIETQHTSDPDATITHYTSTSIKPDAEPDVSDSTTYRIGNDECSGSDQDGWEWTSHTGAETEMQGVINSMIGVTPVIDDPVFVAAETVNGVPSNHFNFKVSGLGSSSGSVVNINQGDYWLAVDGQYIVKYLLTLEMSQAANSEVLHQEISIELNNVNGPVSIAFPQGCLEVAPQPTNAP